jgi:hypothetical protein
MEEDVQEARRQHYVPQFYLRNFSISVEGRSLGILNIKSGKFIERGSLRDQACRDFFYGKDGVIEKLLAKLEEVVAAVISKILLTKTLPPAESEGHLQLLIFVLFLHCRTLHAAEAMNELFDKTVKWDSSKSHPEMGKALRNIAVELRNPISWTLSMMENGLPLAADLNCKLLINHTDVAFVTSDNPAVFYNQLLETLKAFGSCTGLACKGLEVFLPLSPTCALMYYDGNVYKVGDKKQRVLFLERTEDIHALNGLQYASAHANLYFDSSVGEQYVREVAGEAHKFRPVTKAEVCERPDLNEPVGGLGSSAVCYTVNIKCGLHLTFVTIVKKARGYSVGNKIRHVRDEAIFDLDREFRELLIRGKVQDGQFGYFLMTKDGPYAKRARSIMMCFRRLAE